MPETSVQLARRIVHHTLGNSDFDMFHKMAESVVCAVAILTPENTVTETERLISAALELRRPVYFGIPGDIAVRPIVEQAASPSVKKTASDPVVLESAVRAIAEAISASKTACILPGIIVARSGLKQEATAVVEASGLPFATMFMDKSVLDETHPSYIGMYSGKLMNEEIRAFVEECDCLLGIGAMMTDANSGAFTANIDRQKFINIMPNSVRVGTAVYEDISMKDVLKALATKIPHKTIAAPKILKLGEPKGKPTDKITAEYLYPRWQKMLRPNDILVAETGSSSLGLGFAGMPKGATFQNQTLWGSIGWATPAAFGAALADPNRRTILVTGEGSHQLTVQEISQFHRFGLKPIIFVLNNNGYLIERLLCEHPEYYYNDLAQWHYSKLPEAFGCDDWFTARVTTCNELNDAINKAENARTAAYIEVVTDKYAASPLSTALHGFRTTLYSA